MKIRKILIFLTIALSVKFTNAQVGGISASKVGTFCAGTVPGKDLEFEPAFSFSKSNKHWNANSKLINTYSTSDSAAIASEFSIRCTYGFSDKFEMGIIVPSDIAVASLGAKFKAWTSDFSAFSIIAGGNMPLGNRVYSNKSNSSDEIGSFAGGLIFSHQISDKFHWDVDIQGQKLMRDADINNHSDFFVNTDIGYYPIEHIQLIGGMGYYSYFFNNTAMNKSMLDIHPGISYETGENFLIVLSSTHGLIGMNEAQHWGINMAFTMTIR